MICADAHICADALPSKFLPCADAHTCAHAQARECDLFAALAQLVRVHIQLEVPTCADAHLGKADLLGALARVVRVHRFKIFVTRAYAHPLCVCTPFKLSGVRTHTPCVAAHVLFQNFNLFSSILLSQQGCEFPKTPFKGFWA